MKHRHACELLKGKIRLSNYRYFRAIEKDTRGDESEGVSLRYYEDTRLKKDSINDHFLFSVSENNANAAFLLTKFDCDAIVTISNPEEFIKRIIKALKMKNCATEHIRYRIVPECESGFKRVLYVKNSRISKSELNAQEIIHHLFEKDKKYKCEREFRIAIEQYICTDHEDIQQAKDKRSGCSIKNHPLNASDCVECLARKYQVCDEAFYLDIGNCEDITTLRLACDL